MVQCELRKKLDNRDTGDIPPPNAVYKFGNATVRIYGTCSNIQGETEKFLKRVMRASKKKQKSVVIHDGTSGNSNQTI